MNSTDIRCAIASQSSAFPFAAAKGMPRSTFNRSLINPASAGAMGGKSITQNNPNRRSRRKTRAGRAIFCPKLGPEELKLCLFEQSPDLFFRAISHY